MEVEFIPSPGATEQEVQARKAELEAQGHTVVMKERESADAVVAPSAITTSAEPRSNPLTGHPEILSASVSQDGDVTLVIKEGAVDTDLVYQGIARDLSRAHGHDVESPSLVVEFRQ